MTHIIKYSLEELPKEDRCPECGSPLKKSGGLKLDATDYYCTNKDCAVTQVTHCWRSRSYSISKREK